MPPSIFLLNPKRENGNGTEQMKTLTHAYHLKRHSAYKITVDRGQ